MSTVLNDTIGTAKIAMESAREGTVHAASRARSTLLDGLYAVSGIVGMLRGLDLNRGLGWIGLSRRTGPFHDVAVFSAGLAVGAGAGLLFAPMSGADTRRAILDQVKALTREAKEKVENKVVEGAEALKDKVDTAADAVKDNFDAVKDKVEAAGDATDEKSLNYPRARHAGEARHRMS